MKEYQTHGFTLIELMIVVVIVSILVAIAYPAYLDQVRKSRRADCAAVLTGLSAAMERKFTENNTYRGLAVGNTSVGAPAPSVYPNKCPVSPPDATYYTLNINAPTDTTYTVTATPVGDQAKDACKNLSLTETGVKSISATGGPTVSRCW
ncbi:MAG TPA: prepilin-type N-terminal cleavage/methylation domain-containing protein [Gammaproteobacteria bacterium]|nr:prepilin-type N-terminal cleavage/methylation domain-containing protein [Gammaproteobacteria bacterium]